MKNAVLVFCALGWASNAGIFLAKREMNYAVANAALAGAAGAWIHRRMS